VRWLLAYLARWEAGLAEIESRMTPEQRAFAYWLDRGGWQW
jgi:hypothetical protein